MKDYVIFRKHLCISFELMSINLYDFLKLNDFDGLSLSLIRRFAIQLLYALKYLKENDIIHCDLKPENILLKDPTKSGIKIIDFCEEQALITAKIIKQTKQYGLSLGDRGCIALAMFKNYPILTCDKIWQKVDLNVEFIMGR